MPCQASDAGEPGARRAAIHVVPAFKGLEKALELMCRAHLGAELNRPWHLAHWHVLGELLQADRLVHGVFAEVAHGHVGVRRALLQAPKAIGNKNCYFWHVHKKTDRQM